MEKNKIEAINSLAIPTVQYSCGIIDWKYSELKKLRRQERQENSKIQRQEKS